VGLGIAGLILTCGEGSTFDKAIEKEILQADIPAVYVDEDEDKAFASAIADLVDDPARRRLMGRIGRRRIETILSWQGQVPAYVSIFEALAGLPEPVVVDLRPVSAYPPQVLDLRDTIGTPMQRVPQGGLAAELGGEG